MEPVRTPTRTAIVQAAVAVFGRKGFAASTLEEIGALVGLSRQGVLRRFPSKEALFAEVIADQAEWARRQYFHGDASAAGDLWDLRDLVPGGSAVGATRERLQTVQVLQGEAMTGHGAARAFSIRRLAGAREQIAGRIERAQAAGQLREDLDPTALSTLVSAVINGLQAAWLLDADLDAPAVFDVLLAALRGIRPSKDPGHRTDSSVRCPN